MVAAMFCASLCAGINTVTDGSHERRFKGRGRINRGDNQGRIDDAGIDDQKDRSQKQILSVSIVHYSVLGIGGLGGYRSDTRVG